MTLSVCVQNLLYAALLEEVQATPKPGLVDRHDSGAHRDMTIHTFRRSAAAIAPHLGQSFAAGLGWSASAPELFQAIRPLGRLAEADMFFSTGGVNTHRGAIFTLGILASAAGLCYRRSGVFSSAEILRKSREMCAPCLQKELRALPQRLPRTHGEQLYLSSGAAGIRGEAMAGFPALEAVALPALREGEQPNRNAQLLKTLLQLTAFLEDTTILHRAGPSGLAWAQMQARAFLSAWPVLTSPALEALSAMNAAFVQRNISPGGAADLLAAAIFLEQLEAL